MENLLISDNIIFFKNSEKCGIPCIQESFVLPLNDIKIVGIKCSMILDDPIPYYILVDRFNKIYTIHPIFFNAETHTKFHSYFSIPENSHHYPDHFYNTGHSFIIYPKKFINIRLFKKWNEDFFGYLLLTVKKIFLCINPAMGILSNESYKI